jgi:hypothetical protein
MYFLLNDVVLSLELQLMTPPMMARRFSALTIEDVQRLGRELFAEEPRLQHRRPERAKRLACLIVSKAPELNAALFVAPSKECGPDRVAVRLATLDIQLLAELHHDQQAGKLTAAVADRMVWSRHDAAA